MVMTETSSTVASSGDRGGSEGHSAMPGAWEGMWSACRWMTRKPEASRMGKRAEHTRLKLCCRWWKGEKVLARWALSNSMNAGVLPRMLSI